MKKFPKHRFNPDRFEAAFEKHFHKEFPLTFSDTILIAYSGGVDSSVLVHLLDKNRNKCGFSLVLGYFNHRLRGEESEQEEEFVRRVAAQYGLSVERGTGDVKKTAQEYKISLQESARRLRYEFLQKTAEQYGACAVATAHHRDDFIETVLMRILQGATLKGLGGIPKCRGIFIRPLLWAYKSDILQYSHIRNISYFEDSTNSKVDYTRNIMRLKVLPYLRETIGTNIDQILFKQGERFQQMSEFLNKLSRTALEAVMVEQSKDKIILDITAFNNYFTIVRQLILTECLKLLGEQNEARCYRYADTIVRITSQNTAKKYRHISKSLCFYCTNSELILCRDLEKQLCVPIEIGKQYTFPEEQFQFESCTIPFDKNSIVEDFSGIKQGIWDEVVDRGTLNEPLQLRYWRLSDRFHPLGMSHTKKLSDFFNELKISYDIRKRIPILIDKEKVVWICGLRIDDRVKITPETTDVVGLKYTLIKN